MNHQGANTELFGFTIENTTWSIRYELLFLIINECCIARSKNGRMTNAIDKNEFLAMTYNISMCFVETFNVI